MKKNLNLILILFIAVFSACKKDNNNNNNNKPATKFDLIRDSVYMYAQECYLWNDALPTLSKFNPRSFTDETELDALQKEVDAISQFKLNPATNKPYEFSNTQPGSSKYSFIDDGSVSDQLGGNAGDFGFEPRYGIDGNVYIKYVYPNSPAGNKGITRGDRIVELNGQTNFDSDVESNVKGLIESFYLKSNMSIKLQKADGTTPSYTLNTANYTINPVLKYKTINTGSKKVGYIVFNMFTSMENAKAKIDEAFTMFTQESVTDLVVDFRYNGGGYVSTAEYLCNKIVPVGKNNSLMYTTIFNEKLQKGDFPLVNKRVFDNQLSRDAFKAENNKVNFHKEGTLSVNKAVFILTGSSASASELVINSLLPHMDVKIVGEPSYGKPVGFFSIPVDKYDLYLVQFANVNAINKSDYYQGMIPGSSEFPGKQVRDDVARDFGDVSEACLANALSYINIGSFSVTHGSLKLNGLKTLSLEKSTSLNSKLEGRRFKGMILNK